MNWKLRLKLPESLPKVGKFSDELNIKDKKLPIKMYYKEEEIQDDDIDLLNNQDSNGQQRKKSRRYSYKKRSTIVLENGITKSNQQPRMRFEGKLEDMSSISEILNSKNDHNGIGNSFQYAILQLVKETNEILVIPVEEYYYFQKHGMKPNESLEAVKDKIEQRMIFEKNKLTKFKEIGKVFTERKFDENDEEIVTNFTGGFESNTLFGDKNTKRKGNATVDKLLDDSGLMMDEIKENESLFRGDYAATFADDDEQDVKNEQHLLNEMEDRNISLSERYGEDDDNADKFDDDEDDEYDEETEEATKVEEELGLNYDKGPRGMVDESMEKSAKEARPILLAVNNASNIAQEAKMSLEKKESSNTVPAGEAAVKSALKRSRLDETPSSGDLQSNETNPKNVSFSSANSNDSKSDGAPAKKLKPKVIIAGSQLKDTPPGSKEPVKELYELSDDGVRKYITNRGGAVTIKELTEVFKDQMKRFSELKGSKKAGKEKLLDICMRVTVNIEHAMLGKALALKN